jgi:hypothetical protein
MLRCRLIFFTAILLAGLFALPESSDAACNPQRNILTTGNSWYDAYDCVIIAMADRYGHPDPRILKAQVEWESRFDPFNTSQDSPCGIPQGWTDAESKSFGLLQVTPACGEGEAVLLANGRPNLTKNTASALWRTSIFRTSLNIELGVKAIQNSLVYFKQRFPSCDPADYTLMAAAGYVQGWGTVVGCGRYTDPRQTAYVNAVLSMYRYFASLGGWTPDPYP